MISFYKFLSVLGVSVRKRHESGRVYDAFVNHSEMLGVGVSPEEIWFDHINVTVLFEKFSDLVDQVLTHDAIVELPGPSHIVSESLDLAADFAFVGSCSRKFGRGLTSEDL